MINSSTEPSTSTPAKHFLSARPSILQDFPSSTEEQRFRDWLYIRQRASPARFSLFCITVVGLIEQLGVAPAFGAWDNLSSDHIAGQIAGSVIWSGLLLTLVALPSSCKKYIQIANVAVYAVNIVTVFGVALTANAFTTFAVATMNMFIMVIQPYTWKAKLPFFGVVALSTAIRAILEVQPTWLVATFCCCSFAVLFWEREHLLRQRWAAEQRHAPAILDAQRNATHDVRNALQEVLAIVELGQQASGGAATLSPSTHKDIVAATSSFDITGAVGHDTVTVGHDTVTVVGDTAGHATTTHTTDAATTTVIRVRTAISRITDRLETSLRDSRNVVMDELSRLAPEIKPCSLGQMIREDFALDPLVFVTLSEDLPLTVETDAEWLRSCVSNLVHNAKKHGPQRGRIQVVLSLLAGEGDIRVEISDEGVILSPTRAKEIWNGQGRKGGIGIRAVRSYVNGLGGKFGYVHLENRGSTFWVQVPGGTTTSFHEMSSWTMRFAAAKAENSFLRDGHLHASLLPGPLWSVATMGVVLVVAVGMFLASAGSARSMTILHVVMISSFAVLGAFFFAGQAYFSHRPILRWWCRTLICLGIVGMDISATLNIAERDNIFLVGGNLTAAESSLKYLPGVFLVEAVAFLLGPLLNFTVATHLFPIFLWMFITKVMVALNAIQLPGTSGYERIFARGLHVMFQVLGFLSLCKLEYGRRTRYVAAFRKDDLTRELKILEMSARARAEEVQRDATRIASHQVTGVFNSLLAATMRIKHLIQVGGADPGRSEYNKELSKCFQVVAEARLYFISLQRTDRPLMTVATRENPVTIKIESKDSEEHGGEKCGSGERGSGERGSGERAEESQQHQLAVIGDNIFPRVLVVDDNEFCREFVVRQVREMLGGADKCRVDGVGVSAQHALSHLLEQSEDASYHLVLMDLSMPGGGDQAGIWVTRQYKLGRPNSTTRFVCLSGMGRDADVTRICKDAGFAPPFSLGKPVKWDEMKDLLATLYL